jgi:hypothetical protein
MDLRPLMVNGREKSLVEKNRTGTEAQTKISKMEKHRPEKFNPFTS